MCGETRTVQGSRITEAVEALYGEACTVPDPCVQALLEQALEKEAPGPGKMALELELKNFSVAAATGLPLCQDTGVPVVFVSLGHLVHVTGGTVQELVDAGTAAATRKKYLRSSLVASPLFHRTNTGNNTPAVVHLEQHEGDTVSISILAKGAGCENVSRSEMLLPLSGEEGIVSMAEDCVRRGASRACPPVILGIGVGGTLEKSGILSKKALLRKPGERNSSEELSRLEERITRRLNGLGIGPQGFGGECTVLETRIVTAPCHMASLPVTVCVECHAHRSASCVI